MIARLSGTLLDKAADTVIVDVGGVGYLVHLSLQSMTRLPAEGARVDLRTYTHVREDALQLYGFAIQLSGGGALISALVNLGYKPAAAERTADAVRRSLGVSAPVEDQLREALRLIAGAP